RGPNEAGKTTLLAFARAMLFGFETHKYPAYSGGKRGGWLDIVLADGRALRIERYGERGGSGKLRVVENDIDLGPGHLAQLLQGVESTVYRNIFAFGLAELTRFETLRDDEVAARIYGAGLGTGGVSGLKVEQALRDLMEERFKTGGSRPTMNALLRALEEIDHQLTDRDLPRAYAEAGTQLDETLGRLRELEQRFTELDAEHRRRQRIVDGWEAWLALLRAQAEREAVGDVPALDDDILERLSALETRLAEGEHATDVADASRERAGSAFDSAAVDEAALEHRDELEALVEATRIETARADERARAGRAFDEAQAAVAAALGNLGAEWTVERVEAFDDSVGVKSTISGRFRTSLVTAEQALAGARTSHQAAAEQAEGASARALSASERVGELRDGLADRPTSAARSRGLREIEQLRERLADRRRAVEDGPDTNLEARREALDERRAQTRELAAALASRSGAEELLPSASAMAETAEAEAERRYLLPAAVAIGGLVLAVVLALLEAPTLAPIVVAVAGIGGGVAWAWVLRRSTPASASETRARLERQRAGAAERIGELGSALGLGEEPGEADLGRLEAELEAERRQLEKDEDRAERVAQAAREEERLAGELAIVCGANGLPDDPSAEDVEAFSAAIEQDRRTEAQLAEAIEREQQLRTEADGAAKRVSDLAVALEERAAAAEAARAEWSEWLEAHDLETSVDPETAVRIVDAVTSAKQAVARLRTAEGRQAELAEERAAYVEQVRSLARALEPEVAEQEDVPAIATLLAQRLADALAAERARGELAQALGERAEAFETATQARDAVKAELDAFLAEASVEDGAMLRSEVARARRGAELDSAIASARATLTTLSGPGEALASFEADLGAVEDITSVEANVSEIAGRLGDLDDERDALNQEAGRLRASREEMETDAAATELRQEREDLLSRLRAAAEQWTTLALAHAVLKRSRSVYEEAHRPAVVEKAERFFSEWTDGRYRRIIAPLGEDVRGIERRDGAEVAIPGLSRGTSEQLYLALRFGLVQHFVETSGEPLPIVMDDILVNFDPDRAARAARSIEELATTCQIIYFTCHESTPLEADLEESLRRIEVP
ncbi:MAG: AAA family ATPase, partial [Chloroflexota bacterium]